MSDRGLLSHLLYGGSLVILCPFFDTKAPFCVALLSVRGLLSHLLCAGWVSCHTRCAPSFDIKAPSLAHQGRNALYYLSVNGSNWGHQFYVP